jgi:hypothetical protein
MKYLVDFGELENLVKTDMFSKNNMYFNLVLLLVIGFFIFWFIYHYKPKSKRSELSQKIDKEEIQKIALIEKSINNIVEQPHFLSLEF